jgi:peptidoglycan/xylan/chitin deacetylase (PgdA/CDA1 family)
MRRLVASFLAIASAFLIASAPALAASATVYSHGSRGSKVIALTFDDGWNVVACQTIFNTLRSQHVAATFFPYSDALTLHSTSPAFWRAVAAAGYPIADHSQTHPNMTALSYDAQLAQLTNSADQVLAVTGVPVLRIFRPPGGNYNATTLRAAGDAGFDTVLLWDTSDGDTATTNVALEIANAEKGTDGSVVLMHCGPATTPSVLPAVIAYYRAAGFEFVTVGQMFGVPYAGPPMSFAPGPIPPIKTPAPATPKPAPKPTPKPTLAPTSPPTPTPSPSDTPTPVPSDTPTPAPSVILTAIPSPLPSSLDSAGLAGATRGSQGDDSAPGPDARLMIAAGAILIIGLLLVGRGFLLRRR